MQQIEQLREQIRNLGWDIQEVAIHDKKDKTIVGWKIRGVRCRERFEAFMPSLLGALEEFYKLAKPINFGPNDLVD